MITRFRRNFSTLFRNEDGAVATEYTILLATLVVSFIWFNKTADTLLFGADPYLRFGDPTKTEAIPVEQQAFNQDRLTGDFQGYDPDFVEVIQYIAGDSSGQRRSDRSHVGQIHRHLSLP